MLSCTTAFGATLLLYLLPGDFTATPTATAEVCKNEKASNLLKVKGLILSGWQDSNLRPPAPKAGAMTGLRYTPNGVFSFCKRTSTKNGTAKIITFFLLTKKSMFLIKNSALLKQSVLFLGKYTPKYVCMKCVIIDDEAMDLMALGELLKGFEDVEVVGKFQNPIEAKSFVESNQVDLIVLDVEMPELNGLDFIKSVKDVKHVILISSNKNYAAESYDYNVSDYIVKPLSKDRLSSAIDKIKTLSESMRTSKDRDFAFVKDGTRIIRVEFKDILFIEALADYVQINTIDGRYTVLATMKSMQANLPENDFFRVHRSYIIRKDKIKIIEDNMILMGDKSIPISRSAKQEFFNTFNFL